MGHEVTRVQGLLERIAASRLAAREDPFANPVLDAALAIARLMDEGVLGVGDLGEMIRHLRDKAYVERASRLAHYVGGTEIARSDEAMRAVAQRLTSTSLEAFQRDVERTRFSAVFTAHPTFSMPPAIGRELAGLASGDAPCETHVSHRPTKPTLMDEFDQSVAAILAGRDALDHFSGVLLTMAKERWPQNWHTITPQPIVLSTWVGYDTDGRTDINWWDTIRLRLEMKRLQLERLRHQVSDVPAAAKLMQRLDEACKAVTAQKQACPQGQSATPADVAEFARVLIGNRDTAFVSITPITHMFDEAIAAADEGDRIKLSIARAGLIAHGLSLAHTQFRLNSAQLHNAMRQYANLDYDVEESSRRRTMLAAINTSLASVKPLKFDFGALLWEPSSAVRLMMVITKIITHIDNDSPIRFHIAETESGYTLLCALWLARLFGIEDNIEISPLFETAEALEQGSRVLDEALRSSHWRHYLEKRGVLALEFGYSDSGRYVGQLAASYLIERQRLKIAELLAKHDVVGVDIIIFDTHGESIGRGAHPGLLLDRFKFLNPTRSRKELTRSGLLAREESAFQGGDGYLLFGSEALAMATVARIAEHVFDDDARPEARRLPPDPVYDDPDLAADFFGTIRSEMESLVEDPGYAALLGTFGPALLDPTGSRPSARQSDGLGGPIKITHPRELRAIPNNAILQQLGWCANTLQGLGTALSRHPQAFAEFFDRSPRFRRAIDFVAHGLHHSDIKVLQAIITLLDPGSWLNRAEGAKTADEKRVLMLVSTSLEQIDIAAPCYAMLRKIQTDALLLRSIWPDAPMMSDSEILLHSLRLALIQKIWQLSLQIPEFSPRHGVTRQALVTRMLQLDVPATLELLERIFPRQDDSHLNHDYHEASDMDASPGYERTHLTIFKPIAEMFDLVREISTAIAHSVGAFG